MAVIEVKLSSSGSSGSINSGDERTIILGGAYRSNYLVQCDSASDTAATVLSHFRRTSSLPWIGRRFKFSTGFDNLSFCRGVDAKYVEKSGGRFLVEARFEPATIDVEQPDDSGGQTRDPFQWHDEIEVSYTQFSEVIEFGDFRGFTSGPNRYMPLGKILPITNSARIPFDPPLEREVDIKVIRITRISQMHDDSALDKYNNTVNSDRVTIYKPTYGFRATIEPYRGKLKAIGASFQIQNGVKFWRQTAEVHIHPGSTGWIKQVLDAGMAELYTSGETTASGMNVNASNAPRGYLHEAVEDSKGYPLPGPPLLDGKGKRLAPNAPAVYAHWLTYKAILWAGIRW